MSSFRERYGKLTVARVLEMNAVERKGQDGQNIVIKTRS